MIAIKSVVVAGAGTMGAGIAQVFAQAGFETLMVDVSEDKLQVGVGRIRASLDKLSEKGKIQSSQVGSTLSRISLSTDLGARPSSDLFIEAVPEDFDLKAKMFRKADSIFEPNTIFGSNTSGLSITKLAGAVARSERVIGLHFFNPVPIMKLLEIVVGSQTSSKVLDASKWLATKLGKEAIVVKDSPGFATSRLGICLAFEAIRMLESGVASAEDIDKAMVLGYGHPVGPLRLTDIVGLDVRLAIGEHLHESLGQEQFKPPQLLQRMAGEGNLGQKTGRGFYSW